MADTFSYIINHIVFSTKYRRRIIDEELRDRLYAYMGGIIRNRGGVLYEIGGIEDHVHLLIRWNTSGLSDLVRDVKSESTKWVRQEFPGRHNFQWQTGGGIFSVSYTHINAVTRYIQRQEEHHSKTPFEDEYIRLLKRHGLYDEKKNIWD